jgi:hypothetical protein
MSEPTLFRVTSPRAFMLADLQQFVIKALTTAPTMPDAHAALLELVEYIDQPAIGLFLVRRDDKFVGLALVENNFSALSPDSRKLLIQTVMAFSQAGGLNKIRGFDINNRPAAFARLFRAAGPARELARIYEFEGPT